MASSPGSTFLHRPPLVAVLCKKISWPSSQKKADLWWTTIGGPTSVRGSIQVCGGNPGDFGFIPGYALLTPCKRKSQFVHVLQSYSQLWVMGQRSNRSGANQPIGRHFGAWLDRKLILRFDPSKSLNLKRIEKKRILEQNK